MPSPSAEGGEGVIQWELPSPRKALHGEGSLRLLRLSQWLWLSHTGQGWGAAWARGFQDSSVLSEGAPHPGTSAHTVRMPVSPLGNGHLQRRGCVSLPSVPRAWPQESS